MRDGDGGGEDDEATGAESSSSVPGGSFGLSSPLNSSRQARSVDDLLRESVLSFHREGPLVNPMEGQPVHAIEGWHERTIGSSLKEKMQFVAEVKGFEYGIFWRYQVDKKCFTNHHSVLLRSNIGGGDDGGDGDGGVGMMSPTSPSREHRINALSLYVKASLTMFSTWIMGFGMPGRVGYTGNYEWHEEITCLPPWSFQRLRQAKNAELKTVIAVLVAGGVVEFGGTRLHPHSVATVQYVQKIMGSPPE